MKAGLLALSLVYLFMGTSISFAANGKLFRCYKPINPYDSSFEQGQERFLDIFIVDHFPLTLRFDHYDLSGDLNKLPVDLVVEAILGHDFTTFSSRWEQGRLSMVYLGGVNWGAHLNYDTAEEEFMCQELLRLEEL